jgi:hypothetical protein
LIVRILNEVNALRNESFCSCGFRVISEACATTPAARAPLRGQLVAGAATAGSGFREDTALQQFGDVTQRGVLRTLSDGRPLAAGQVAVEAVDPQASTTSFMGKPRRAACALSWP